MASLNRPGRIFISYRREDAAYAAGWLYDRLSEEFGSAQVFKDVDSLQPGDDFVEKITQAVGSCDVLLAVMGPDFVTAADEHGKPRLHDRGDFVRLEIEAALVRRVRVIPLLVEGARMPRSEDLPSTLASLVRRHALELTSSRFKRDTEDLVVVLREAITASAQERSTATVIGPHLEVLPPRTATLTDRAASTPAWRAWVSRHWLWLVSLLGAAALVAGIVGVTIRPPDPVQLPDEVMVWRRDRGEGGGLATITASGTDERSLTAGGKADSAAVITRDRRAILFLHRLTPSSRLELHVVFPDSSGERTLFADGTRECPELHRPAVDHDGRIAVVCSGFSRIGQEPKTKDDKLLLMQQDGTVVDTLATGQLGDPTFTRDGSSVVYWRNGDGTNKDGGTLYEVPTLGFPTPVPLTDGTTGQDADPACSPVSDEIAFRHESSGKRYIEVIRSGQGRHQEPRRLAAGGVRAQDPTWSPDGSRLAFRGGGSQVDGNNTDLWLMAADGTSAHRLVENPDPDGVAAWSSR